MKSTVDLMALKTLTDHPRVVAADERLAALGRQKADAEADLRDARKRLEMEEANVAQSLERGSRIGADVAKKLDELRARIEQKAQVCRVFDKAVQRESRAGDALLEEVQVRYWVSWKNSREARSWTLMGHYQRRQRQTRWYCAFKTRRPVSEGGLSGPGLRTRLASELAAAKWFSPSIHSPISLGAS